MAESNNRLRFNDTNIAATSVGTTILKGTKFTPTQAIKSTPFEASEVVYTQYIAVLHTEMQHFLMHHSSAVYQKFATYYRSNETMQKEKDNNDFIPKPCNILLTLQPHKIVEQSQRFNGLAMETESVINQCCCLLKIWYLKNTEMNVQASKDDITQAL